MTLDELSYNIEKASSQYKQACEQESLLYDYMRQAEQEYSQFAARAESAEEEYARNYARERAGEAAKMHKQYQEQLQQVLYAKTEAEKYLLKTRDELEKVIQATEEQLPKIEDMIRIYEQMASNPFGASANNELPRLRIIRHEYQENLNTAYSLIETIDSALSGESEGPVLVLRR